MQLNGDHSHLQGSPGADTEKELAEAFKRGEPGAYEAIYERFSPKVSGVTRRMLGDPHDAEEAAQEAFLKVYQALPRFNGRYQLGAWISRITTNVCLDHLRSRSRKPCVPSTLEELDLELSEKAFDESPEYLALRSADSRYIRKVLAELPPMHRAAIVLRDFEGLSYEEVAHVLEITPVQCKALIHRARQNFKRSWLQASVAALLPWRLFDRMRGSVRVNEHANQASRSAAPLSDLAAQASQVASGCSAALQQCGAVLTERMAGAAAATVIAVGSFAAGTQIASSTESVPQPSVTTTSSEVDAPAAVRGKEVKKRPAKQVVVDPQSDAPATDPVPEDGAASPAPSPSPTTPAGSGGGEGSSGGGGTSVPSPKPSPTPTPFSAAIGFDSGTGVPYAMPSVRYESVDCGAKAVNQQLEIPVWDGYAAQTGRIKLQTSPYVRIIMEIDKDGRTFTYDLGAPSITVTSKDTTMYMAFSGSYSYIGTNPETANLPGSGRFQAQLTLDCTASRVITESITL